MSILSLKMLVVAVAVALCRLLSTGFAVSFAVKADSEKAGSGKEGCRKGYVKGC